MIIIGERWRGRTLETEFRDQTVGFEIFGETAGINIRYVLYRLRWYIYQKVRVFARLVNCFKFFV